MKTPAPDMIIFVYGTLRPGGHFWPLVAGFVRRYQPATLQGYDLWDLPEGYPAITPNPHAPGPVHGDLLFIPAEQQDAALAVFDEIEGCCPEDPNCLYDRLRVEAYATAQDPAPGELVSAFTYVYHPSKRSYLVHSCSLVPGGDWNAHRRAGLPTSRHQEEPSH